MNLNDETEILRRQLNDLASDTEEDLQRYELTWPRVPTGIYWKLRWFAALALRALEHSGLISPDPWPTSLKQANTDPDARAYLIWAVGADSEKLPEACRGFSDMQSSLPGFAPVLVTDVADFSFCSRLGWLVEYLPHISGYGEPYDIRKARFILRLYSNVPAFPWTAGLHSRELATEFGEILKNYRPGVTY